MKEKLKKLVKKGGVADIVTLVIIVGLVIGLIVAVVVPMLGDAETRRQVNEDNMGMVDTYVTDKMAEYGVE